MNHSTLLEKCINLHESDLIDRLLKSLAADGHIAIHDVIEMAVEAIAGGQYLPALGIAQSGSRMECTETEASLLSFISILASLRFNSDFIFHVNMLSELGLFYDTFDLSSVTGQLREALTELKVRYFFMKRVSTADYKAIFFDISPETGEAFRFPKALMGFGPFFPSGLTSGVEKGRIRELALTITSPGMKILEVGTFLGWGSTPVLADIARRCDGRLSCVESFAAQPFFPGVDLKRTLSLSMQFQGIDDIAHVEEGDSPLVAERFPDGYFDLIFIDGDHSYAGVIADLKAWKSKVRSGGILCGHDCYGYPDDFIIAELKAHPNDHAYTVATFRNGEVKFVECFAGITLALGECFGSDYEWGGGGSIWSRTMNGHS